MQKFLLALAIFVFNFPAAFAQDTTKSPNISANALMIYRQADSGKDHDSEAPNGLLIQEAELAYFADVDPFTRFQLMLGIHPELEWDAAANEMEQHWHIAPEELYAESLHIPSLSIKAGMFRASFGKHNLLHTHALPFIEPFEIHRALLGDEGLVDVGLSASYLTPLHWFSELTVQALRGEGENAMFQSPSPSDTVMLGRWRNLFDLSDEMTLEVGLSLAQGNNAAADMTRLKGFDATLKWRPSQMGRRASFLVSTELIGRDFNIQNSEPETAEGFVIWARSQVTELWSIQAKLERMEVENVQAASLLPTDGDRSSWATALEYRLSEFSSYRMEYSENKGWLNVDELDRRFLIQASYTIGAHPAHYY